MRAIIRRLTLFPLVLFICVSAWPAYWLYLGSAADTNEFFKEVLVDIWEGAK